MILSLKTANTHIEKETHINKHQPQPGFIYSLVLGITSFFSQILVRWYKNYLL